VPVRKTDVFKVHGALLTLCLILIKSSRAVSCFNKLKLTDVSGTISVPIRRESEVSDALRMGTEIVPETSASFSFLTQLIAREDFINSCRRESFKSNMCLILPTVLYRLLSSIFTSVVHFRILGVYGHVVCYLPLRETLLLMF
jgi:hypothetical protein